MEFQTDDVVGDYRVLGVLGKGGMGRVYRVLNLITERVEAMKVVLPDGGADLAERFLHEVKLHASLDHPNIARLNTALRRDNRLIMFMELVEGSSLEELLRQGPIPPGNALHYMEHVLAALSYAHGRGIIHRDIKPANILITSTGLAKLTDFGIARSTGDIRLTQTGMALGSVYYMSPEQVSAGAVDARSDIYSLGVTLYEMIAGRRPFEGENAYAVMNAHLTATPSPPTGNLALWAVILTALAKPPASRFQTADEFLAALRSLHTDAPATAPQWDPRLLEEATRKLAAYMGPIAKVLVERTARRTRTPQELYKALAAEISSDRDRAAFLASVTVR